MVQRMVGAPIQLFQQGRIAWAAEIGIEVLGDKVEKGSELRVRVRLVNCFVLG